MELKDIPKEELSWTDEPVIGLVLINAERDSNGTLIDPMKYYMVAKHKPSGMIIIVSTERNMKNEFVNDILREQNKFN